VQIQVLEGEADHEDERFGGDALPGVGLVDPVADVGVLERAPLDARQVHLPDERAGVEEDPHGVGGVEVPLPGRRRAPGPEGGRVPQQVG
jgi:hypothetical protein